MNCDWDGTIGHRNLHLQCRDGSLTWNVLFLAPLVSESLWEAVTGTWCSQSDAEVVQFQLPDYSTAIVRCFLDFISSGETEVGGEGSEETLKELRELLLDMCGDLQKFSEVHCPFLCRKKISKRCL